MKIYDISMLSHPEMIVYPVNPAPRIEPYKRAEEAGENDRAMTVFEGLNLRDVPAGQYSIFRTAAPYRGRWRACQGHPDQEEP
jgi:hypothetical protein